MQVDSYGTVGFTQREVVDHLRVNPKFDIAGLVVEDGDQYKDSCRATFIELPKINTWDDISMDMTPQAFHAALQSEWLMPDEYKNLDIKGWLYGKCSKHEEIERVNTELDLYNKFDLLDLLRYLKFLRDVAETNNIVWGVGRGSSCCSYCLYLMGVHRVDSSKYNLDINDFLR